MKSNQVTKKEKRMKKVTTSSHGMTRARRNKIMKRYCGVVTERWPGVQLGNCDVWLLLLSAYFGGPRISKEYQRIFDSLYTDQIPLTASERADAAHKKSPAWADGPRTDAQ